MGCAASAAAKPAEEVPVKTETPATPVRYPADYGRDGALDDLKTITTQDLHNLRDFKQPPEILKYLMEAICVVMEVAPGDTFRTNPWRNPPATDMIDNPEFIDKLARMNKDTVKPSVRTGGLGLYVAKIHGTPLEPFCPGKDVICILARWFAAAFGPFDNSYRSEEELAMLATTWDPDNPSWAEELARRRARGE